MSKAEIKCWFIVFILNSIIFLPRYLLEADTSTFIPYEVFLEGPLNNNFKLIYERNNYDIFRLSIDLFIFTYAFYLLKGRIRYHFFTIFLFLYYTAVLIYQIYHQLFEKIYNVTPVFYNDLDLILMGFSIVFTDFSTLFFLIPAVFFTVIFIYYLIGLLLSSINQTNFGRASKSFIIALAIAALISLGKYGFETRPEYGFQVQAFSFFRNISASFDAKKSLGKFDMGNFLASNDYQKYDLDKRPNLYLIIIESYGRILLDNPMLFRDYRKYLKENELALKQKQWHACSQLSLSPISGGKSWVSYASLLYGYNFKNQSAYATLSKKSAIYQYNHLLRLLHLKGYKNYRVNSIFPEYYDMLIPWEVYTKFYAVDKWIRFEDLQYTGKLHGFGPSPSDQYTLNFAYHYIKERGEEPYTLFFLNQNSHRPFYGPEKVVENWQDLSDGSIDFSTPSSLLEKPTMKDYSAAIRYQINYISDFILRNGSENDIFILIGDHQPPVLANPEDGFETPVHIISQDPAFVDSFIKYGFNRGLLVTDTKNSIKHEGIYSMLIREFIRHYGRNVTSLPEYRPNGVEFQ